MSEAYRDIIRTIELDAPLATDHIGMIVQSDAMAHRFVLTLQDAGKSAALSGYTVSGVFENAYGETLGLTGSISGNVVTVILPEGCYHVPGDAAGFIRVQNSDASVRRTVLRFTADVEQSGSGVVYDPDKVIGDISTLLAKIAAMEAATTDGLAAAREAREAGTQAIADAQNAGDEAKATAKTAADDATAAAETARATIYTRANAIPDSSALAASHTLYAQRDYPLGVTVHGYIYQEGEGDPSPDNVRPIYGLDAAQIRAGGKNLFMPMTKAINAYGITMTIDEAGKITFVGTSTTASGRTYLRTQSLYLTPGTYTASMVTDAIDLPNMYAQYTDGTVNIAHANWTKTLTFTVKKNEPIDIGFNLKEGVIYNVEAYIQLEIGSTATAYEPYLATTADLPILPDNAALMEGDTIENWVRSGCDVKLAFNSSDGWEDRTADAVNGVYSYALTDRVNMEYDVLSDAFVVGVINSVANANKSTVTVHNGGGFVYLYLPECTTLDELDAYLSANPLTVYYRSTDYTPEKDLRVCRVKRYNAHYDTNKLLSIWSEIVPIDENNVFWRFGNKAAKRSFDSVTSNALKTVVWNSGWLSSGETSGIRNFWYNGSNIEMFVSGLKSKQEYLDFIAENNVEIYIQLATPEVYMTDPLPLLPPAALESETVTVTGSGETEVEYAHETKHYIDSQIAAAVALALGN